MFWYNTLEFTQCGFRNSFKCKVLNILNNANKIQYFLLPLPNSISLNNTRYVIIKIYVHEMIRSELFTKYDKKHKILNILLNNTRYVIIKIHVHEMIKSELFVKCDKNIYFSMF